MRLLLNHQELNQDYKKHIQKQQNIWKEVYEALRDRYMAEGYYQLWAEEKARRDILELRSAPKGNQPYLTSEEAKTLGPLD